MQPVPTRLAAMWLGALVACGPPAVERPQSESEESGESQCPSLGTPLEIDSPTLQPDWADGCDNPDAWTATVEKPVDATWTIEVRRTSDAPHQIHIARALDGVALVWNGELILIDGDGLEQASRDVSNFGVGWQGFVTTENGLIVFPGLDHVGYWVLDPMGEEIWHRAIEPTGSADVAIAPDGSLWISFFDSLGPGPDVRTQKWDVMGELQSEVWLHTYASQGFAHDGMGRFGGLDYGTIDIFEPDGTHIELVELYIYDDDLNYIDHILGRPDGFVVGVNLEGSANLVRIDGSGEIMWRTGIVNANQRLSYMNRIAASAEGGYIMVGGEATIDTLWPESPIESDWGNMSQQYSPTSQPFVAALDEDGELTWGERLAVRGRAWAVTVGAQGEVYVAGTAQAGEPDEEGFTDTLIWLRRYDP